MNKKLLILGITILLLAVGLSGCVEQKSNVDEPTTDDFVEGDTKCIGTTLWTYIGHNWVLTETDCKECGYLEPEPEYQDFSFLAWIVEDAFATDYYNNKILDEWKKDYDDVSFYDLKNYAEERQDIIEQSQYDANQFILSYEYDAIRDEWYNYLEDAWMNDKYLIAASDCMIGYSKDYDCYSTNIDLCEIYTELASAHVSQTHKMIDELE